MVAGGGGGGRDCFSGSLKTSWQVAVVQEVLENLISAGDVIPASPLNGNPSVSTNGYTSHSNRFIQLQLEVVGRKHQLRQPSGSTPGANGADQIQFFQQ